ncbi:hypothetical protein GOV09_03315 [Candidatus Woesearchaeota archaeon]|nr:hypothetical protein [Candidatus Woesearchaeota archaeon]
MHLKWILIVAVLASMSVSAADFLDLSLECENDICIRGHETEFNLTIFSKGKTSLYLLSYSIIDAADNEEFITFEAPKPIYIIPALAYTFSTDRQVPNATRNNSLVANVCLTLVPDIDHWGKSGKYVSHCYADLNFSFPITQCLQNDDCPGTERCIDRSCVPISCIYCQYPSDNTCKPYECCRNEHCSGNQFCEDNECKDLRCEEEEFTINHTCSATNCLPHEGLVDFKCAPLDCGFNAHIIDHDCVLLNCSRDEYFFNHTCRKLNCTMFEFPLNMECHPLDCLDTEAFTNHTCIPSECSLLKIAEGHECRINSNLLFSFFLLIMILFLFFLNKGMHNFVQKKKMVNILLEKAKKRENIKSQKQKKTL